jgi:hypothetical protein
LLLAVLSSLGPINNYIRFETYSKEKTAGDGIKIQIIKTKFMPTTYLLLEGGIFSLQIGYLLSEYVKFILSLDSKSLCAFPILQQPK